MHCAVEGYNVLQCFQMHQKPHLLYAHYILHSVSYRSNTRGELSISPFFACHEGSTLPTSSHYTAHCQGGPCQKCAPSVCCIEPVQPYRLVMGLLKTSKCYENLIGISVSLEEWLAAAKQYYAHKKIISFFSLVSQRMGSQVTKFSQKRSSLLSPAILLLWGKSVWIFSIKLGMLEIGLHVYVVWYVMEYLKAPRNTF